MPTPIDDLITAACTAAADGGLVGGIAQLPDGDIILTDTVTVSDVRGLVVRGGRGTRLVYRGPGDRPVFRFAGCQSCTLERVGVFAEVGGGVRSAVQITNLPNPQGGRISNGNRLSDVWIHAPGWGQFIDAIEVHSSAFGGSDQNNEFHKFERVRCTSYSRSGAYIYGGQIHQLQFRDCEFGDHHGIGQYGVYCYYGAYLDWEGGTINASREADFFIRDFVTRVSVRGLNSEGSRRLLMTGGPGGAPVPIRLSDIRWAGRPQSGDYVVSYLAPGPLVIDGVTLDTQDTGNPCVIQHYPPTGMGAESNLSLRNVTLSQSGGATAPLESPVRTDALAAVDEFNLTYRWWNRPSNSPGAELNPFRVRWPADLTRLAVPLPGLPTQFPTDPQPSVDLSGVDFVRGWSLAGRLTVPPGVSGYNPNAWTVFNDTTMVAKMWAIWNTPNYADQLRFEGSGALAYVPNDGAELRFVVWVDPAKSEAGLRVNGVEDVRALHHGNPSLRLPPHRLTLGGPLTGTLSGLRMWRRPLSAAERTIAT